MVWAFQEGLNLTSTLFHSLGTVFRALCFKARVPGKAFLAGSGSLPCPWSTGSLERCSFSKQLTYPWICRHNPSVNLVSVSS